MTQSQSKVNDFVQVVETFYKQGGGLMIFEDNDTIEKSLSNIVLRRLLNFTLEGNDLGEQLL